MSVSHPSGEVKQASGHMSLEFVERGPDQMCNLGVLSEQMIYRAPWLDGHSRGVSAPREGERSLPQCEIRGNQQRRL